MYKVVYQVIEKVRRGRDVGDQRSQRDLMRTVRRLPSASEGERSHQKADLPTP